MKASKSIPVAGGMPRRLARADKAKLLLSLVFIVVVFLPLIRMFSSE